MKEEVDEVVDSYDSNLDEDTDSSFSPPALCFHVNLHQKYFFKIKIKETIRPFNS